MQRVKLALMNFMRGRYGMDRLNNDLVILSLILIVLSLILRQPLIRSLSMVPIILLYFRMLSRQYTKRYSENRIYSNGRKKVTNFFKKIRNRIIDLPKYKYYRCSECKQQMRVPRGRKSVIVTCPKCRHTFEART